MGANPNRTLKNHSKTHRNNNGIVVLTFREIELLSSLNTNVYDRIRRR